MLHVYYIAIAAYVTNRYNLLYSVFYYMYLYVIDLYWQEDSKSDGHVSGHAGPALQCLCAEQRA